MEDYDGTNGLQGAIPIVFDKSHLLTIGERLYSTSLDLIRELVSNAYDADATQVAITITPERVVVADNGSGMDDRDLRRYFTIGARDKRFTPYSPRFGRERIGEFGIGKFSALTVARQFVVDTQRVESGFHARVVFDSEHWERDQINWHVPYERLALLAGRGSGTTITLNKLKKPLDVFHVARHVRERLPVGHAGFSVLVNGVSIQPTAVAGKHFPFAFDTPFGRAHGDIILANLPPSKRTIADAGITIRVKGVVVTRSLFGFDQSHAIGVSRLRGVLHADFVPITSSRDNVINDAPEFLAVCGGMRVELKKVLREARELAMSKENLQASRALKEALERIGRALKRNPGAFTEPPGDLPVGSESGEVPGTAGGEEGYSISKAQIIDVGSPMSGAGDDHEKAAHEGERPLGHKRHIGLANRAIIRTMQFRNLGLVCRMERFGEECPPSFFEQGIIYVNIDHPLYRKQMENDSLLQVFLASLISKELSLQKYAHDAHEAFRLQHELLTDAFRHVKKL